MSASIPSATLSRALLRIPGSSMSRASSTAASRSPTMALALAIDDRAELEKLASVSASAVSRALVGSPTIARMRATSSSHTEPSCRFAAPEPMKSLVLSEQSVGSLTFRRCSLL
jgi:hypothetical protein